MGPRVGLDGCRKSRLHRDVIPRPSSPQTVDIPTELSLLLFKTCLGNVQFFYTKLCTAGGSRGTKRHIVCRHAALQLRAELQIQLDTLYFDKKTQCCWPRTTSVLLFMTGKGELSYLAPLGSENISAPYFKQCFFGGVVLPPSQTPRLPVPRQK